MGQRLATAALGPILIAQGWWTRKRTPVLPEAAGPRAGETGEGPLLRLLVLGDSAAAGVGAVTQDEALTGRLVHHLSDRFRIRWRLLAENGATTSSTIRSLEEIEGERFDVAVTSLGVNDAVSRLETDRWLDDQRRLRAVLRDSFGADHLVVSGLPPMGRFPALPQPLRWYLGEWARGLDAALAADVASEPDVTFLPIDFSLDPTLMASDGFHPGPLLYEAWGREVARVIASRPV